MATITKIFRGEHKGAENVPLVSYRLDGDKNRTMPIHDKLERRDKGRAANEHGQKLQTIRELFKELSVKDKEKLLSEWTTELEKDKDFEQGVSQLQSAIDENQLL